MRRPKFDTTYTPRCPCPACGKKVDAASPHEGSAKPKPGSASICFYCGTRLVFTRTMRVRLMTDREWQRLDAEHRKLIEKVQLGREQFAEQTADFPHGFPEKHKV